jgi:hypothetical protein
MPKGTGNKKVVKPKRFTQAAINRGFKHSHAQLHSQYTGYHSRVILQMAKRKVTDRKSQFLTHLATALKAWYAQVSQTSEIEIQIAIYNDEYILIASNKNETATLLYEEFVKAAAKNFLKELKTVARTAVSRAISSKATEARRVERHATKLQLELKGERVVGFEVLSDLEHEGRSFCTTFDVSEDIGGTFASFLNGQVAGKQVAVLTSTAIEMHAEQKILLALCKAAKQLDTSSEVVVAGTFRPCRGCYESLNVVQKYCFQNLQFGVRPGHFWRTTTRAHVEILNKLLEDGYINPYQRANDFDRNGRLIGLTNTSHRPVIRNRDDEEVDDLHYGSDSESEVELD